VSTVSAPTPLVNSVGRPCRGREHRFGDNESGELWNTTNNGDTGYDADPRPTLVSLSRAQGHFIEVAGGEGDTLVVTSSGQLYTFGSNVAGQPGLATGTFTPQPGADAGRPTRGTRVGSVGVRSYAHESLAIVGGRQSDLGDPHRHQREE